MMSIYTLILRSTHDLHTLPGDIFFSRTRYPSMALARNKNETWDEPRKRDTL